MSLSGKNYARALEKVLFRQDFIFWRVINAYYICGLCKSCSLTSVMDSSPSLNLGFIFWFQINSYIFANSGNYTNDGFSERGLYALVCF